MQNVMRVASLVMLLLLTSCAKQVSVPQDFVEPKEKIPGYLLNDIRMPLADDVSREAILVWGLEAAEEIRKKNCALYTARKLNDKTLNETPPEWCVVIDKSND